MINSKLGIDNLVFVRENSPWKGRNKGGVSLMAKSKKSQARMLAVANQKGGVGKTTTTINLADCLADRGNRVLIVDCDPQANATTGIGIDPRSVASSTYDVIVDGKPLLDSVISTSYENLWILPSNLDLAGAEIELQSAFNRERRLQTALSEAVEEFDYIFVDCLPSLGLLAVNALTAVKEILVPIQCEYYALEGLMQLKMHIAQVRRYLNSDLELAMMVLVMYDSRTKLSLQVAKEVCTQFGDIVAKVKIPRSVRLAEAPSHGAPIRVHAPKSTAALAYRLLAEEFESR